MFGASWRTTAAAVAVALGTIFTSLGNLFDADPTTTFEFANVLQAATGIAVALGLWNARDNKVSSEEAGAAK